MPTPAAARYIVAGEPRPPAPMHSTRDGLQLLLPLHAHLGQDEVTAVALDFLGVQRRGASLTAAPLPPATDGMMLSVSPGFTGVASRDR